MPITSFTPELASFTQALAQGEAVSKPLHEYIPPLDILAANARSRTFNPECDPGKPYSYRKSRFGGVETNTIVYPEEPYFHTPRLDETNPFDVAHTLETAAQRLSNMLIVAPEVQRTSVKETIYRKLGALSMRAKNRGAKLVTGLHEYFTHERARAENDRLADVYSSLETIFPYNITNENNPNLTTATPGHVDVAA